MPSNIVDIASYWDPWHHLLTVFDVNSVLWSEQQESLPYVLIPRQEHPVYATVFAEVVRAARYRPDLQHSARG